MDIAALREKAAGIVKRLGPYKYVLLVIAAGVLLLVWPGGEKAQEDSRSGAREEENFSVAALEAQLEETLSRIDGAGEVTVMLTVRSGMERILAQDESFGPEEETRETVIVSTGSGKQEVVLLSQRYPTFQGALVVCPGGEDARVKLLVTQAVSALTGLSSGRISVCKGT